MKPFFALILPALALAACSPSPPDAPTVAATDAWCRATPPGAQAAGCFLNLTASAADRLVAVESDAGASAEIHTMSMTDGIMRMRRLEDGLALPAGQAAVLKPGAEHLMIIGPKAPLIEGQTVTMTLTFDKAAPVTVAAPVRAMGAPLPMAAP
jgi:copper(I)-binding protein